MVEEMGGPELGRHAAEWDSITLEGYLNQHAVKYGHRGMMTLYYSLFHKIHIDAVTFTLFGVMPE